MSRYTGADIQKTRLDCVVVKDDEEKTWEARGQVFEEPVGYRSDAVFAGEMLMEGDGQTKCVAYHRREYHLR